MSLPQSKTYLKNKKKAIPLHIPMHLYRPLMILAQELGTTVSDEIGTAILNWINRPKNRALLKQTRYDEVNPVEKVFI